MRFGLRDWANRQPERVAVVSPDARMTYRDLEEAANRLARLFRRLGLRRGDHVAACIANDPLMFALAWAAYRAGLYFTPISNVLSTRDIAYIVDDSTARLVVIDPRIPGLAEQLPALTRNSPCWFSVWDDTGAIASLSDAMAQESGEPLADETPGGLMLYTSGTTGAPKGVWRPLPPHVSEPPHIVGDLIAIFDLEASSRYLSTAPLYHGAPLRFSLAFLAVGGSVQLMAKFDAATALDLLETAEITHSQWVPTMFHRLLALPAERREAFRAPHHRFALHGAAPCPARVKRAMIDWWGPIVQEYYAGSESLGLTTITSEEWLRKPGSVGRCVKGKLHILGDAWEELPSGQTGRIYFSGIAPFQYFNAPEKTKERESPQGFQTLGDIGYVDQDGYLFVTDRQDDMIISGGVNIYPQEVEAALLESPEVDDCAVVGMADPEFGERAVAFVVMRDRATDADATRRALIAHCASRLGRVKGPKEIRFVAELPRSPTGKLLRRMLRSESSVA